MPRGNPAMLVPKCNMLLQACLSRPKTSLGVCGCCHVAAMQIGESLVTLWNHYYAARPLRGLFGSMHPMVAMLMLSPRALAGALLGSSRFVLWGPSWHPLGSSQVVLWGPCWHPSGSGLCGIICLFVL